MKRNRFYEAWLSATACLADARGARREPQKAFPALPLGKAGGSPSQWPKAGYRHAGVTRDAVCSQPMLDARLYV